MACRRAFARVPEAFELLEADTAREGIRLARTERLDCLLLDYQLPDMNGLEVLAELAVANGTGLPVVMLTGANDIAVAVEAMRRGARDYLLKDTQRHYLELLPHVVERAVQEQRVAEEKRQAESALAHAHRVMTAGELAAALAHELNQPLAAIATFSEACIQLLARGAGDPEKLRKNIEQIALQAQRAGHTIRELRAFLAQTDTERKPTDLNALVRNVRDLTAAGARAHGAQLTLDLAPSLPPVLAAAVHVEHVLVNLVQNSLEAIRAAGTGGGSITLSTRQVEQMAQVSVRDNGPGLSAEAAQRMFEPFYTTKTEGLGMGLAIGRRIVEAHGGKLWADTAAGPGATFHFTLPLAP